MRKTARYAALAASGLLALSSLTACANDAASTASTGSGAKGDGKGQKINIMVGGLNKVIYLPAMLNQRLKVAGTATAADSESARAVTVSVRGGRRAPCTTRRSRRPAWSR